MIFTTCGRVGAHGPTVAECRNYYSGHAWAKAWVPCGGLLIMSRYELNPE